MAQRSNTESTMHNRLIELMVNKLEEERAYVRADHIGHRNGQPENVNGHIPDIEASSNGTKRIIEAETPETFNLQDTKNQFIAFYNAYGTLFEVIVPKGYEAELRRVALNWGITLGTVWEARL
jgi:hypothetical protein